ncbi:hypothetical protein [Puerhibacterium puerhi]|uniref:hypothetical protein n=1 Tax=Puerhibacterium puerhi TaxID=2692623 RepID=UPI00135A8769|nr:hypothetical protein [Puerhibacterium puerhi]
MTDTLKLDPAVKEEWLEALRSGKYKQARSALHDTRTDSYCCLGVLCDIAAKHGVGGWDTKRPAGDKLVYVDPDGMVGYGFPPEGVVDWAHGGYRPTEEEPEPFGVPAPSPDADGTFVNLWELNDNYGFTFEQIADVIEKNL